MRHDDDMEPWDPTGPDPSLSRLADRAIAFIAGFSAALCLFALLMGGGW